MFENKLGESITVQIKPNIDQTLQMLTKILDGSELLARSLVQIIYSSNPIDRTVKLTNELFIDQDQIAIWIDPIGIVFD